MKIKQNKKQTTKIDVLLKKRIRKNVFRDKGNRILHEIDYD